MAASICMPAAWTVCILDQAEEILLHQNTQASPATFLRTIAPYRADIVVAVECMLTRYWLTDLCARQETPFVLGHALYLKAIHSGKAQNDTIDAHTIAVRLRGGMLPQAYVDPAERRATRDPSDSACISPGNGRSCQATSRRRIAHTTCLRLTKSWTTKPPARTSLSSFSTLRFRKALNVTLPRQ